MSMPTERDELAPALRTMQIISLALVLGGVWYLLIVVFIIRPGKLFAADPWDLRSPISAVALVMAMAGLVGHRIVQNVSAAGRLKALARGELPQIARGRNATPSEALSETGALLAIYQVSKIVGAALLEGPTFFAIIAYQLEGRASSLIAAVVLVVVQVLGIPTRSGLEEWVERKRQFVEERRQSGGGD